jgi:transcriptional regulator of acetoin/glycerol metabolism
VTSNPATTEPETPMLTLEERERKYIFRILALVKWNKNRAAALLGISRATLYRRLKSYEGE